MTFNEQNTLLLIRKGDLQGFRQLFDNYYTLLCAIANGYLNHRQLAEEVAGDIFYKIWENRDTLCIHTSLKSYLVRAVRNRCLNCLEQRKTERYILDCLPEESCRDTIMLTNYRTPLCDLITEELEQAVEQAIESLPAECRVIFRLSRSENLSYEEIARQQNISINTVKTQMKIALQKIRQMLAPYLPL